MSKFLYVAIAALLFGCASGVETTIPLPTLTCFPAIVDCHDGADCSQGQVCYPTDIDGGRISNPFKLALLRTRLATRTEPYRNRCSQSVSASED